ncbi:MAG: OsmC family protein [Bacteroidales bacterium]|nr:OsmC family protein [Bacteroidales bacterium]MBN2699212.1 OsmC family protein [Bacteroidales bacterium]
MKESVSLQWLKGLAFEADIQGHKLYLDATGENGGNNLGTAPKPLMMVALAGCTGMDVVSILDKMRVQFDAFSVEVKGELSDEHPKKYTAMKVIFRIIGENVPQDKVEKAVNLSKERYCGVSENYRQAFPIEYEILYE